MSFEISGKLIKVFETESKSASFQARDFVIETTTERYPQMIKFQLTQDRCSIVDNYQEGNDVKVFFDLRGREWNGKYFTNLNAWKIEAGGHSVEAPVTAPNQDGSFPSEDPFGGIDAQANNAEDFGDLPF